MSTSVYHVPAVAMHGRAMLSHTAPTTPYRAAGRPEVMFVIERTIDLAARRHGFDRVALRRRNLVPATAMPYRNPLGLLYDSGDYAAAQDRVVALADWAGFEARRAEARRRGRYRGIGLGNYIELNTGMPRERTEITVQPEGRVDVVLGTLSAGQGHETSFPQLIVEWLGVAHEQVRLITGDTDQAPFGGGSHSGRSMRLGAVVMAKAADEIVARGRRLAAWLLEAAEADIEFAERRFRVKGTDHAVDLFAVAAAAQRADAPDDLRGPLAAVSDETMSVPSYPYGCAVCELEVDPETGAVEIVRYTTVDDVGRAVNPLILHGQTHGGIAAGVGQALMELCHYDPATGQTVVRHVHGLRDPARRSRCRRSTPRSARCPRRPTRSGSAAAARAAPRPRWAQSSTRSSMRWGSWASSTWRCRPRPSACGRPSRPRAPGLRAGRAWDKLAAPQRREVQRSSGRHPEGDGSMANLKNIDTAFTQAVESKKMPGIVAAAVTDKGTLYEGAFGTREIGKNAPMTLDTIVWIASMTKAITATAAMQLVEKGKLSLDQPASSVVPELAQAKVLEGWDGDKPTAARAQAADDAQAPAHPHLRLLVRDLARGHRPLPAGHQHAGHHHLHQRRAHDAAALRSRRSLGLRHRHRLGRQDGRGGVGSEARRLLPAEHLRPARHEGHRLQALGRPEGAGLGGAPARRQGRARAAWSSGCRRIPSS